MTKETSEKTASGLVGKAAGKAKELAGELTDNDALAREGRLQQSHVDAAEEAQRERAEAARVEEQAELAREQTETRREREELEAELEQREREQDAEAAREVAEDRATSRASEEPGKAVAGRENEKAIADSLEERGEGQAERKRVEAARLEDEAREAEATANVLDPEEER